MAYHFDGVLIVVVDGCLLELAGGDVARNSLSICGPLVPLETSRISKMIARETFASSFPYPIPTDIITRAHGMARGMFPLTYEGLFWFPSLLTTFCLHRVKIYLLDILVTKIAISRIWNSTETTNFS